MKVSVLVVAVDECSKKANQGPEVVAAWALARTDHIQQKATPTSRARAPWLGSAGAQLTHRAWPCSGDPCMQMSCHESVEQNLALSMYHPRRHMECVIIVYIGDRQGSSHVRCVMCFHVCHQSVATGGSAPAATTTHACLHGPGAVPMHAEVQHRCPHTLTHGPARHHMSCSWSLLHQIGRAHV